MTESGPGRPRKVFDYATFNLQEAREQMTKRKKNLVAAAATALAMMLATSAPAMAQEIDFDDGLEHEVSYDVVGGKYLDLTHDIGTDAFPYLWYPYLSYYPYPSYGIDFERDPLRRW